MPQAFKNKKLITILSACILFLLVVGFCFWNNGNKIIDVSATGGDCVSVTGLTCTQTTDGQYTINTYILSGSATTSTTWTPPAGVTQAEYLVVAGGGAGAGARAPGGGGGGVKTGIATGLSSSTPVTVTVGTGGTCPSSGSAGASGANSVFSAVTATGGAGATVWDSSAVTSGGSGSGGTTNHPAGGAGAAGQGYAGGVGVSNGWCGGGGGAGGSGGDADPSSNFAGSGGRGIPSSITGSLLYYAGGGGAGTLFSSPGTSGIGGIGGGGNGGKGDPGTGNNGYGFPGTAGTGGGGGGAGSYNLGGAGGSGTVIIRYVTPGYSSWLTGWNYRKTITVNNTSGGILYNYQVKLTVPYSANMQTDFDDIRFATLTDSNLSYWLESKTDSTTASFWIMIPSLAVGSNSIYMYYGNSSAASASNGDATFVFFDDFSGTSFDSNKWTTQSSPTVSGGYASFRDNGAGWTTALSKWSADDPRNYEIYARYKLVNYSEQRLFHGWEIALTPVSPYPACSYAYSYNQFSGAYASTYVSVAWTLGAWYTAKHVFSSTYMQTATLVENGSATSTSAIARSAAADHVFLGTNSGGADVDWVFVRRHASADPTLSIGATEESSAILTSTSISTANLNICRIEGSSTVCKCGQSITFNSVAAGANSVKLYVCKDSACTDCTTGDTVNCWAYSSVGATSNPTAVYDSSVDFSGTCGLVTSQYWSKVCNDTNCSGIR